LLFSAISKFTKFSFALRCHGIIAMALETIEALAYWRLHALVNTKVEYTETINKNRVVGVYTSCALEDFEFIFDRLSIRLSDIERQELIFLLFETVASIADIAEEQPIDCSTIYTHQSLTLPVRVDEVDIISKWLSRHITTPEQYFMAVTQAYHTYTTTYYTIALLPNFQNRLDETVNLYKIYFATVSDETRKEILKYYYNHIFKNRKDVGLIQDFFMSYVRLIFIKLLYIFTMHSNFDNIEEARAYTRYTGYILQKMEQKYIKKQS
jgi:hypothetical protein